MLKKRKKKSKAKDEGLYEIDYNPLNSNNKKVKRSKMKDFKHKT